MSVLPLAAVLHLAASCAPTVAPETLLSVVRTESGFHTTALHDNSTHRGMIPATTEIAAELAAGLIALGHSVDVGLAQINSANLRRLGITVAQALDPCTSLRAEAIILAEGYRRAGGVEPQRAIRAAVSAYNTGSLSRGFANGYVRRVEQSAAQVVPAIRVAGSPYGAEADVAAPEPRREVPPLPTDLIQSGAGSERDPAPVTRPPQPEPHAAGALLASGSRSNR